MALLATAPAQLSAGSFLEWEALCAEQPWTALRRVLERRLPQFTGEDDVRRLLLIRWASENGPAALAWTREHFPDKYPRYSPSGTDLGSLGMTWAWHDPAGFIAAQKTDERLTGPEEACWWVARRDPVLAFAAARVPYNPSTDWTRGATSAIAPYLKTTADSRTVLELVMQEKHADSDPPVNYVTSVLQAWADIDETEALAAAAACPGNSTKMLKDILTDYIMRGKPQTEATADEWLERLSPDENRRANGMKEITKGLMSADMGAAGRWLLKQDPETSRDSIRDYLQVLTWRDPAAALTYVQNLPTTGYAEQSPEALVAQWAADSPSSVTDLLKARGWSEDRISQLKDRMAVQHPEAALWWWDW